MMMKKDSRELAWLIRRHAVEMTHLSGGGHIGSILSVADIIAVLYADVMKYDPDNPAWNKRDRLILSKGHAGAALYAALAENGFFDVGELKTHYANGSRLSGHVSHHVPGVDFSTGSLGHGLAAAAGMALAAKQDKKEHWIFAILGDGECDEGAIWETALFASHFRLDHLIAIIDYNQMQSLDFCERTLGLESLAGKWEAFGWDTVEIDGNNHEMLRNTLQALKQETNPGDRPHMVIAKTKKGHPISFMEQNILWHYRFPHSGWEYDNAVKELYERKPEGAEDPYTPEGIKNPVKWKENDDVWNDHTLSATWHPTWLVKESGKK